MKTKNLLITICLLFYVITDAISQNAGIPVSEYNALVDLYNSTLGEEWTNNSNWLDTLNHSVADWYGVTVENGHVTQILLNNNALQNSAFTEIIYLPKLRCLELGNNKLTGFNFAGTDSLANLDTLILFGNALIFEDLSPAFSTLNYPNFSEHFYYFPQEKIDVPENVTKYDGQFFSFDISQEYISTNDKFQWYNDTTLIVGENSAIIQFSPVTQANSGTYHVEITNPDVPNLRLQSYDKTLYVNSSVGAGVPLSEYNALVDFYNSTQGNNWTNNTNWLDTIDHEVNDWYGITVENGHVTEIYFGPYEKYNLNGSIPNSIKDLPKLESFVIVTDDLNGELPEGLYELKNLKTLYLSECRLSGQLSPSIGNLTNLEKLGLEANNFNGSIPYEIGYLSHLKFLSLYENGFTGKIPSSIGNLTNLEYLGLSQNNLNGTIPASIGNLTNLGWLLLNGNQITGPLPIELVNLENIIKINIENNLIGFIDSTLKSATITNTFSVDNRQIPDELSGLIQMDTLYLAGNNLQFNDIEAIFNWENYRDFKDFVYSPQDNIGIQKTLNKYTGENTILSIDNYYPGPSDKYQWFKNNSAIQGKTNMELELTNIQLTDAGEYYCKVTNLVASELTLTSQKILLNVTKSAKGAAIPVFEYNALVDFYHSTNGESWGYNANWLDTTDHTVADWVGIILEGNHVSAINLDSNNVTGILPATIANLSNLKMISLEKNGISGIIPDNIGNLSNLETLSLSSNNISGEIPNSIIEMENLKYLLLSGNNLEGEVPSEIGNDTNLEGIWLNYNNLSGEIPASLGNLSKLRHLYLDHNLFTGTIPASLGNLTDLRTLDLSNNQLVGPLPVELQNLTKLSRLEIDNNLIGDIDFNKSANIENYRQIPDELAGLLQMDTLYIGDNNLQFNDIEAIFNWDNYIDFNDFIYTPQDSIGSSKTIEKLKGEDVVLSIDNYYAGPSDKYQWYKNGTLLSGKTNSNLTLNNLQLSDADNYYCKVTNSVATELTLTSRKITLNITKSKLVAGVPYQEYEALFSLYNIMGGENWNFDTNWLDTTNHSIKDWYGITVENGHVTKIDLSSNGLSGELPDIFSVFDSITYLNVSINNLYGNLPLFYATKSSQSETAGHNLTYLNLANNSYVFSDLEPIADELLNIDTFIYSPQNLIGILPDTVIYEHDSITIEIEGFVPGENDLYSWTKDESTLSNITEAYLKIEDAALGDSGNYYCLVENSLFPDLTLKSRAFLINVLSLVGVESQLMENIVIFPNPAQQQIFVDTKNKLVDIKIYNISGITVYENDNFSSDWINIETFPPGIYLFKIVMENIGAINKGVIFD